MFKVTSGPMCGRLTRRSFLQAGVLGVGGLSLADLLRLRAAIPPHPTLSPLGGEGRVRGAAKDTRVILFWMSGGPGHMETWDPKPDAVAQFRGPLGAIRTNVPGVQFGELLPEEAKLMDRLAVLRSVNHGSGDHTKGNHWMLTGYEGPAFNAPNFNHQLRPSLGSVASKLRGPIQPGLPPYVAVPHLRGGTDNFFHYAAYLGAGANPLNVNSDPNSPEFRVRNLVLAPELNFARLESRRHLLETVDQTRRAVDARLTDFDQHSQRAFDLLTSREVAKAFDIAAETAGAARPLWPAHLRPERPPGPAPGRGRRHLRHGEHRTVGPSRYRQSLADGSGRPQADPAVR